MSSQVNCVHPFGSYSIVIWSFFPIEPKTFSWAGIASKNATSAGQVNTSPSFGKTPVPSRQEAKTDMGGSPGSGPQPQRQAR